MFLTREKLVPNRSGRTLEKVVARKALKGGGIQRSERERTKIGLTLTSLKSSAFVNLHFVINGPNEFAKDHQAQTY